MNGYSVSTVLALVGAFLFVGAAHMVAPAQVDWNLAAAQTFALVAVSIALLGVRAKIDEMGSKIAVEAKRPLTDSCKRQP